LLGTERGIELLNQVFTIDQLGFQLGKAFVGVHFLVRGYMDI